MIGEQETEKGDGMNLGWGVVYNNLISSLQHFQASISSSLALLYHTFQNDMQ